MVAAAKLAGIVAGLGLVLVPTPASAAKVATPVGISLSPFQQNISIAPDQSGAQFNLSLTNHTKSLQELKLTARDFGSLNETGGILFEGTSKYTQKYGLTSWMTLGTDTVDLQPEETKTVPVIIDNRSSLQPGGHYGAVVASVDSSLAAESGNQLGVNQQLVSLVFVKKVGGEHYDLKLSGITQNGNWFHPPDTIKLRFQNPGNVHVVPRGLVTLKNPAGKVIAKGVINSESATVLPESFREVYVPLTKTGGSLALPGLYHVAVTFRYDGVTQTATKQYAVRFISLPTYVLLGLIVVVAGGLVRRYKKHQKSTQKPTE